MMKRTLLAFSVAIFTCSVGATQLVYTPTNPSFGGSALNGSYLLGKAQSQNAHVATRYEKSYDETFKDSLQRAYLNKLVREITDFAFGDADEDNPLNNGDFSFTSGDYVIDIIASNSDNVTIRIVGNDGTETIIVIDKPGG
ncbi:MAG: curli production assembly protein CsgF [Gammaproteobacteria bacterium]|nr:curli production assembly protein CsgF [Gammaproteobacteria bacterium]